MADADVVAQVEPEPEGDGGGGDGIKRDKDGRPVLPRVRRERERMLYFEWLLTPDETRKLHGLPRSTAEFGRRHEIGDRQLRRWAADPAFAELLELERRERKFSPLASAGPSKPGERPQANTPDAILRELAAKRGVEPGSEAHEFLEVKAHILASLRRGGDLRAAEQWMKMFGAPHIEAERARESRLFDELDDDALAVRVLELVGKRRVRAWLAGALG